VIPERYLLIESRLVILDMQVFAKAFSANDCNLKKIRLKLKIKNLKIKYLHKLSVFYLQKFQLYRLINLKITMLE